MNGAERRMLANISSRVDGIESVVKNIDAFLGSDLEELRKNLAKVTTALAEANQGVDSLQDGDHLGGIEKKLESLDTVLSRLQDGDHLGGIKNKLDTLSATTDRVIARVESSDVNLSIQALQDTAMNHTKMLWIILVAVIGTGGALAQFL